MAVLIDEIDKIARKKKRDVVFQDNRYHDYENNTDRNDVMTFLEKNNITYEECTDLASENGWGGSEDSCILMCLMIKKYSISVARKVF